MLSPAEFAEYKEYAAAEEAKRLAREAEEKRQREERQAKADREKAEQEEWLKKNRPDVWERQQREKAEVQRMLEKRARLSVARDEWESSWKSESVADIVSEIDEATADMNKFMSRYFGAFDRPGPFIYKWWCRRLVEAYRREHGKD